MVIPASPYFIAIPISPFSVFTFWEINEDTYLKIAEEAIDGKKQDQVAYIRLRTVDDELMHAPIRKTIAVDLRLASSYIDIPVCGRSYVAELGYKIPGDRFKTILSSREFSIPENRPYFWEPEKICFPQKSQHRSIKHQNHETQNIPQKGYFCPVLHAHLPFIRHPEKEYMMEENWLFEAITETYLPLLKMIEDLSKENTDFIITLSLSPTLCTMLNDSLLQQRYIEYINRLIELTKKEVERTALQDCFLENANMYLDKFKACREQYISTYKCDLLSAFKHYLERGMIEIITCCATHSFLPVMYNNPEAIRAQIKMATMTHKRFFGVNPTGMWLPECGYYPGVELYLEECGIQYFFVDTHGLLFSQPKPDNGVYAPVKCQNSSVVAFAIDPVTTRKVWHTENTYPADVDYREFYRDIGFDLEFNYIRPYIDPAGIRICTGIKYYRITGPIEQKEPYNRNVALQKVQLHAEEFISSLIDTIANASSNMDRKPLVTTPFDAELFGHWWFEGMDWLETILRKLRSHKSPIFLCSPAMYLRQNPNIQECTPSLSSWDVRGYFDTWVNISNDWIYKYLFNMEQKMVDLAKKYSIPTNLEYRVLNQMVRELMLAESSDWSFMMSRRTTDQYAIQRIKEHINNFWKLCEQLETSIIEELFLTDLESRHNIFMQLDFRIYSTFDQVSISCP
jgi:1,4-alpha-glucan branching enzyme